MADDHTHADGRGFLRRTVHFFRGGTASLVDRALVLALIYTAIGAVYTGFNVPVLDRLESLFSAQFTVFADLVAVGTAVLLWPALLISGWTCGDPGCGVL
ncbi:hypothetical protein ACQI4F_22730 [Mycolicibacterium vaccae]|uniref:hypothetical protein n=1 Tax=Mycolicibacterium vaccae TaxID=1810 RepID=UPI003CE932D9